VLRDRRVGSVLERQRELVGRIGTLGDVLLDVDRRWRGAAREVGAARTGNVVRVGGRLESGIEPEDAAGSAQQQRTVLVERDSVDRVAAVTTETCDGPDLVRGNLPTVGTGDITGGSGPHVGGRVAASHEVEVAVGVE